MPKNLVLFSDGTGNSPGKLFRTNVWRSYEAVDLTDPQNPAQPRQFAFYDDGVGSSSFKPWALLGGAFGVGLSRNVLDLYVFLCRMYEPGDRIYAFGFSRGAFTIRVLVGLVMSQGLLRCHGNEGELQRLARDAYRAYRAASFKSHSPLVLLLRPLRDAIVGLRNKLSGRMTYAQAQRIGKPHEPDAIEVDFLGLWDTVDAYGLPVDELTRAIDFAIWPLTMRDYNLNPRVKRARHALAIDDERNAFHPRLWNETPDPAKPTVGVPGGNLSTAHVDDERISQVWFAGVHANVGGGYPDDSLSHIPLHWVLTEAQKYGLRLQPRIREAQIALSDENGPVYDSRRGLGGYYRYNPRRIESLTGTRKVKVGRTKVHESVLRRIRAGHDGYAPITLPPGFAVMTISGDIVDGDTYLRGMQPGGNLGPVPPAHSPTLPLVSGAAAYREWREHVYNGVWRRRIAYFATVAITLALAAMPWFAPADNCTGTLCVLAAPIAWLGELLPNYLDSWIGSFSSHPNIFLPLLAALALGMKLGGSLEQRLRDEMRRVWYALPMLRPSSAGQVPAPVNPSALGRGIERLRTHAWYRGAFVVLAHGLVPAAFLLAIGVGTIAAYSEVMLALRSPSDQRVSLATPLPRTAGGAASQASP